MIVGGVYTTGGAKVKHEYDEDEQAPVINNDKDDKVNVEYKKEFVLTNGDVKIVFNSKK